MAPWDGRARVPQLGPDLVSCEVGDSLEDGGGGGCGAGLGGDLVSGDGDGHVPEGSEGLDELLDGHAGAVLQVAGHGQGGEDDGEVGSIESRFRWNTGLAWRSDLAIRKDSSTCHRSR